MEIEFFTTTPGVFTSEVHYQIGLEVTPLEEAPEKLIRGMFYRIADKYPQAMEAIREMGINGEREAVTQFVKCNFGLANTIPDIDRNGLYHLEKVRCDSRKKCPWKGRLCQLT